MSFSNRPRPAVRGEALSRCGSGMGAVIAGLGFAAFSMAAAQEPVRIENGSVPSQPYCELVLLPDLVLGVLDHPAEQAFSSLISAPVDEFGTIYILDSRADRISAFREDGEFIRSFGRRGEGPGEFGFPYRLAVRGGSLVVYDQELQRLSRFEETGRFVRSGPVPFSIFAPPSLAILPDQSVVLAGSTGVNGPVIHLFSPELVHIRSFGTLPHIRDPETHLHLGTGSVHADEEGGIWFSPTTAYEIRKYAIDGTLERVITREHSFDYHPRPYWVREDIGGGRTQVGPDTNRTMGVRVQLDDRGRIWLFTRNTPDGEMVIDVFDPSGRFLQSHNFPLREGAVTSLDPEGDFYRTSTVDGVPRLHRFRSQVRSSTGVGSEAC